jgi:DNA-binding MarR family transcriptional regulator
LTRGATKSTAFTTPAAGLPPAAWARLLRGHAGLTRRMDATLRERHGLNLNEYEVLLQLRNAEEGRLRGVDLAQRLVITQGGVTRLLAGLEKDGLVERYSCKDDQRVVWAGLSEAGEEKLAAARATHLEDVRRLFSDRFSAAELDQLGELLGRIDPGGEPEGSC